MDWLPQTIREGIMTVLFISGPLVVLAATLGLAVGVLQAATQVQEQTLGSAVKIIGLFITLILGGFFIFSYLSRFAGKQIARAFELIPTLSSHPMPRKNFYNPVTNPSRDLSGKPIFIEDLKPGEAMPSGDPSKISLQLPLEQPDEVPSKSKNRPKLDRPPGEIRPKQTKLSKQKLTNKNQSIIRPKGQKIQSNLNQEEIKQNEQILKAIDKDEQATKPESIKEPTKPRKKSNASSILDRLRQKVLQGQ